MAGSIGGAAAEGIESGFKMGMDADAATERKRATKVQEDRQAAADQRAADEFTTNQARQARSDQGTDLNNQLSILNGQQADIEKSAAASQAAGTPIDPALGSQYATVRQSLAATRQKALDFWSRASTGQFNPLTASPADLYKNLVVATGMKPSELQQMPQHIADVQSGIQSGNQGLTVQGVNGLMAPQLQIGVGDPSPHGGTIVRKEIIGLDPAIDANGQSHPDKFIPRMRVWVKPDGAAAPSTASGQQAGAAPASGGSTPAAPDATVTPGQPPDTAGLKYYDAPMTQNRSGDPNDPVVAIQLDRAMNWMGSLGVAANIVQHPEVQAKLAQGEKEAGPEVDQYLTELRNRTAPPVGPLGKKINDINATATRLGMTPEQVMDKYSEVVTPGVGAATVRAKLAAVDDLNLPQDQKDSIKRDIMLGANGRSTGLVPTVVGPRSRVIGGNGMGMSSAPASSGGSGAAPASSGGVSSVPKNMPASSPALGGAQAPSAPDKAIDFWAHAVIAGDKDWQVGLGRSKSGSALIEGVKRRVPELAAELGLEPQDIGTARAQSAALGATLKQLTSRSEAVNMFSNKIEMDMKTYDTALTNAGSDSPLLINEPLNVLRRKFNDPGLAQLDLASKQVGTEYERLLAGGALSTAQLHQGAAEDAKKLINGDTSPKVARALMQTMNIEIGNAKASSQASRDGVVNQIRQLGRGTGPAAGPNPSTGGMGAGSVPSAAAPVRTATNPKTGEKLMLQNGQWVPFK